MLPSFSSLNGHIKIELLIIPKVSTLSSTVFRQSFKTILQIFLTFSLVRTVEGRLIRGRPSVDIFLLLKRDNSTNLCVFLVESFLQVTFDVSNIFVSVFRVASKTLRPVHDNQPSQKRRAGKKINRNKMDPPPTTAVGLLTGEQQVYTVLPVKPGTNKYPPPPRTQPLFYKRIRILDSDFCYYLYQGWPNSFWSRSTFEDRLSQNLYLNFNR